MRLSAAAQIWVFFIQSRCPVPLAGGCGWSRAGLGGGGPGDGADFAGEQARLFPCGEVAAAVGFAPVDDVGEPLLGPAAGGPRCLRGEDTLHPAGTVTTSRVAVVNHPVTSVMLSQYSRAEEAPLPASQYKEMLSST